MKITDWHHLFGIAMTDYFSQTAFTVELEKDLSLKKQYLDVVVVKRIQDVAPADLADGLENMAAHNLISYKSLHEPFDDWAADELIGHYVNYRKQVSLSLKKLLPKQDFGLYAVCTRYPRKLSRQNPFDSVKKGVYAIQWGVRKIHLIVTSQIAREKRNALWLMFSAVAEKITYGVAEYEGKLEEMSSAINQLIVNYQNERIISMPYTLEDYREELKRNVLDSLTPEERIKGLAPEERIKGLAPEERIKGLAPEERIKGLAPEERIKGLAPEERIKGLSAQELLKVFSADQLLQMLSVQDRLKGLSAQELLKVFSADELLEGLSSEEIDAYMNRKRKKQDS